MRLSTVFVGVKHGFVNLPEDLVRTIPVRPGSPVVVQLEWRDSSRGQQRVFSSWSGQVTKQRNVVEVPFGLAKCWSLSERIYVEASVITSVSVTQMIHVEPVSGELYASISLFTGCPCFPIASRKGLLLFCLLHAAYFILCSASVVSRSVFFHEIVFFFMSLSSYPLLSKLKHASHRTSRTVTLVPTIFMIIIVIIVNR